MRRIWGYLIAPKTEPRAVWFGLWLNSIIVFIIGMRGWIMEIVK
jgi:hypothetical protein